MTTDTSKNHLEALEAIKKKLRGRSLSYKEVYTLMDEIAHGRMTDVLTAYFVASGFKDGFSDEELYYLTKAMVQTGAQLHFKGIVADKHSIGGLAGARATMIIVPIVAAAGFLMPKSSSRAITSPAGTADVMETIANVNFTPEQITKIVNEVGGCIVWGGHLGIAPADDIIIRVEEPLSFESFDKVIVSIMAKKIAMGTNHLVIDIPVGHTMKVKYEKDAEAVAAKFRRVAHRFGITIDTIVSHTTQPAGRGIGPYMEAIDVFRVLEQTEDRPEDLEDRSLKLAGKLLDLCYHTEGTKKDGLEEAKRILTEGLALKKFKEIIKAQHGNPDLTSMMMKNPAHKKPLISPKSGKISSINNYNLSAIAKILGAPEDKYAGMYLWKRSGEEFEKGDVLVDFYSSSTHALSEAVETLESFPIFTFHE